MARVGNPDKVAIIIMTDGAENASREDRNGVIARGMLNECRAKGWQVIMLGVDFDNAKQAASYDNAPRFTVNSAQGMHVNSTRMMASKRAAYGSGAAATMSFSDEEKEELSKKKAP